MDASLAAADTVAEGELTSAVSGWYGANVPDCFSDANDDYHGRCVSPDPLTEPDCKTFTITSELNDGQKHILYLGFTPDCGAAEPCTWGKNHNYSAADFPDFQVTSENKNILWREAPNGTPIGVNFPKTDDAISFAFAVDKVPWQDCDRTQVEFTLHDYWDFTKSKHDTYDVSLINGFNYGVTLVTPYGETVEALTPTGHSKSFGVFPLGMTDCTISCGPPCPVGVDAAKDCGDGGTPSCPPGKNCLPKPSEVCQVTHDQSLDLHGRTYHFDLTIHPKS
jgi:hypothetical protein